MTLTTTKTVREYALESPQTIPVFQKFGIDFCCGGNRPLDEACASANLNLGDVLQSIESALSKPASRTERELQAGSLAELIAHIVDTHHSYLRKEIPNLKALLAKVSCKHGPKHAELLTIQSVFGQLADELLLHLMKEESVLFPYIERMEEAVLQHEPIVPAPFGTVANPLRMMEHEHDEAGIALKALSQASQNFTAPEDACTSFRALYKGLSDFEKDLHQHIHLENNVLFPRALRLEQSPSTLDTSNVRQAI